MYGRAFCLHHWMTLKWFAMEGASVLFAVTPFMQIGRIGYIDLARWLYHSWLGASLCVSTMHCQGRPFRADVYRCGWNARFAEYSQRWACKLVSSGFPKTSGGGTGMPGVGLLRNTGPDFAAATGLLNAAPGRVSSVALTHDGVFEVAPGGIPGSLRTPARIVVCGCIAFRQPWASPTIGARDVALLARGGGKRGTLDGANKVPK